MSKVDIIAILFFFPNELFGACFQGSSYTSSLVGNWQLARGLAETKNSNFPGQLSTSLTPHRMPRGVRADSQSIKDQQVKTGQPGSQNGQSVPSQMLNGKMSSDQDSMKAWKEEISIMVNPLCSP